MKRTFYVMGRTYWAKDTNKADDEIMIGVEDEGEFGIRWKNLGNKMVPRLEAFDDSWEILAGMQDLLSTLAIMDDTNPSVDDIIKVLLGLGFEDVTSYSPEYDESNYTRFCQLRDEALERANGYSERIAEMEKLRDQ